MEIIFLGIAIVFLVLWQLEKIWKQNELRLAPMLRIKRPKVTPYWKKSAVRPSTITGRKQRVQTRE